MREAFSKMAAPLQPAISKAGKMNTSQANATDQNKQSLVEEDEKEISNGEHPLAWNLFDDEKIEMLKAVTPPEMERILAQDLSYDDYTVSLAQGSKLDYFVGGFLFAMEEQFDNFQISCFMGLLNRMLRNCELQLDLQLCMDNFTSFFKGVTDGSLPTVTSGMEKFNLDQAKRIINFMHQGIFQHYKLFQNIFENDQEKENIDQMLEIEVLPCPDLPFPAPLHEGMPLDLYEKYVAPPPPTEEEASALEGGDDQSRKTSAEGERARSEMEVTAEMILKTLKPEEIRKIVAEITEETLGTVKTEAESKIKEKETALVSKLQKLRLT